MRCFTAVYWYLIGLYACCFFMSVGFFLFAHTWQHRNFYFEKKIFCSRVFRCLQLLTLLLYTWSCVRLKHCYGSHRALFYRFISRPACHRIHKGIYIMVALTGILNFTCVSASLGPAGGCWNLSFSDFFIVSCHWHQAKVLYLIYSSTSANLILKLLFSKCIVMFLTAISSESTIWKVLLALVSLFNHYQIMATDIKSALPVDQNQHVQIHNVLRINGRNRT